MLSFEEASPLLEAIGMSKASEEILDVPQLAKDLGRTENAVFEQIEQLEAWGLVLANPEVDPPILFDAGKQYLHERGAVEADTLRFLPRRLDDLNARRAVLREDLSSLMSSAIRWLTGGPPNMHVNLYRRHS